MKRRHLIKQLQSIARDKGVPVGLLRQGKHEVWEFGGQRLVIPRHKEIDEHTAKAILRQARDLDTGSAR